MFNKICCIMCRSGCIIVWNIFWNNFFWYFIYIKLFFGNIFNFIFMFNNSFIYIYGFICMFCYFISCLSFVYGCFFFGNNIGGQGGCVDLVWDFFFGDWIEFCDQFDDVFCGVDIWDQIQ